MKLLVVCSARPNFVKIKPVLTALSAYPEFEVKLLHTGQHYDQGLNGVFFEELGIQKPDYFLDTGSGSHAEQAAEVMVKSDPILAEWGPDWVVVVGDVNGSMTVALTAKKRHIKVAHIEAGLRSYDDRMPEEVNRVLIDAVSDLFFVTEQAGVDHLLREGVSKEKIHFVGNTMIDTLLACKDTASKQPCLDTLGVKKQKYVLISLHRPSNVDDKERLQEILGAFYRIQEDMPLVFCLHPRTKKQLISFGLWEEFEQKPNLHVIETPSYLTTMCLMQQAYVVMTDSGAWQEETTAFGVPCLTLRENTERPSTIELGTNTLIPGGTDGIIEAFQNVQKNEEASVPPYWDGKTSERIATVFNGLVKGA